MTAEPLLAVRGLSVTRAAAGRTVPIVDDLDLTVRHGEMLALVGESGSGKSLTAMGILGLLPAGSGLSVSGSALFQGHELIGMPEQQLRKLRGCQVSCVFQNPMTAFNPLHRVGDQLVEQIRAHHTISRSKAREQAVELLGSVGIPSPRTRFDQFPHQFSGGMLQRSLIACALSCEPQLIIADEPTTACDVTIQAQILELIDSIRRERSTAVLLITHDLGVVADYADRVAVMYAGQIVECGDAERLFARPQHPYTWGLLDCSPSLDSPLSDRMRSIPGSPPPADRYPAGCRFAPRCALAGEACRAAPPPLVSASEPGGGEDRCILPRDSRTHAHATFSGRESS